MTSPSTLAAEVERLKAEVLRWSEYESETWKAMKADNERLRAALGSVRASLVLIGTAENEDVAASAKATIREIDAALGIHEPPSP